MWHRQHWVKYKGKNMSLRVFADAFNVPYEPCLRRYNKGIRDPIKLAYGETATEKPFKLTEEQKEWLGETRCWRSKQEDEWEIACDLIGIPRIFADDLKEAMG